MKLCAEGRGQRVDMHPFSPHTNPPNSKQPSNNSIPYGHGNQHVIQRKSLEGFSESEVSSVTFKREEEISVKRCNERGNWIIIFQIAGFYYSPFC